MTDYTLYVSFSLVVIDRTRTCSYMEGCSCPNQMLEENDGTPFHTRS